MTTDSSSNIAPTAAQRRTTTAASTSATSNNGGSSSLHQPSLNASTMTASSTSTFLPLNLFFKLLNIITILLRVTLWPLKAVISILFPPNEHDGIHNLVAADRAARAFVTMMRGHIAQRPTRTRHEHGETHTETTSACPFVSRGYSTVMSELSRHGDSDNLPLLLIFLHSPLHRLGTTFIRDYLCFEPLLELLHANGSDASSTGGSVVCFGASIHTPDGQRLRDLLQVTGFPFLALLHPKRGSDAQLPMEQLLRLEGHKVLTLPPQQITTFIGSALGRHSELIGQAVARRLAREEEVRLRQEQDREYQETLLADQIRELERREVEERVQREEEERVEMERLAEEKERERMGRARELMRQCVEPDSGDVARIRFTLPNGKKVDRGFRTGDRVEVLRAFLMVHFDEQGMDIKNFGISMSYPKRSFREEEDGLTLEEAGLCPQAVVMVQDMDA